jgi:hypothetical protein
MRNKNLRAQGSRVVGIYTLDQRAAMSRSQLEPVAV